MHNRARPDPMNAGRRNCRVVEDTGSWWVAATLPFQGKVRLLRALASAIQRTE